MQTPAARGFYIKFTGWQSAVRAGGRAIRATIAAGNTAPFVVSVTPLAAGAFDFTVTILNDDANESSYSFTVSGNATVAGGGGGGGGGSNSGGCSTDEQSTLALIAATLALCIFAMRRRLVA